MSHPRRAYATVRLRTQDASGYTLRYHSAEQNFAYGRALVVAIPRSRSKKGDTLRKPTQMEMRQLHKLGRHLFAAATKGKWLTTRIDSIAHVWKLLQSPIIGAASKPEYIAVPAVSFVKKLSSGDWVGGHFTGYEHIKPSLIEMPPNKSLQKVADLLCLGVGQDSINLGRPDPAAKFKPFPSPTKRMKLLKKAAINRNAERLEKDLAIMERSRRVALGAQEASHG
jgi:hypothetical protein